MAKPKQDELGGIEGEGVSAIRIKELDQAIEKYVEVRDTRMDWTKREIDAKAKVIELMHAHQNQIGLDANGEIIYRCHDEVAILKPGKEDLKVKAAPEVT